MGYISPRHIRRPKNINNNYIQKAPEPNSRSPWISIHAQGNPFPCNVKNDKNKLRIRKAASANQSYATSNRKLQTCRKLSRTDRFGSTPHTRNLPVIFLSRVLLYAVGYLHSRQIYSTGLSRYPTLWQSSAISPDWKFSQLRTIHLETIRNSRRIGNSERASYQVSKICHRLGRRRRIRKFKRDAFQTSRWCLVWYW